MYQSAATSRQKQRDRIHELELQVAHLHARLIQYESPSSPQQPSQNLMKLTSEVLKHYLKAAPHAWEDSNQHTNFPQ